MPALYPNSAAYSLSNHNWEWEAVFKNADKDSASPITIKDRAPANSSGFEK